MADFQDGMRVIRWSQAYMLPRDGGTPAPWSTIGLLEEEMKVLERPSKRKS